MADELTVWKIAIRDDIRAPMITDTEPYWARNESERDWALENAIHRPREDYTVEEVPGPIARAIADETERFARVRAELWRQTKEAREDRG